MNLIIKIYTLGLNLVQQLKIKELLKRNKLLYAASYKLFYALVKIERMNRSAPGKDVFTKSQYTAFHTAVNYIYLSGVIGDIAEFGTMTGRSAILLARGLKSCRAYEKSLKPRDLLLFDSFEGLPVATSEVDKTHPFVTFGAWIPGGLIGLSPEELKQAVCKEGIRPNRVKTYKGWFANTVEALPNDTKLSVLHIDGDLYQSAIDVLDTCLSRGFISPGAVILFDDWNLAASSPQFGERRAWAEMVEKYKIKFEDWGGYSWHAHQFMIQSYSGEK